MSWLEVMRGENQRDRQILQDATERNTVGERENKDDLAHVPYGLKRAGTALTKDARSSNNEGII